PIERNRIPLSIAFAEVATHNHFVFDRGGKLFKETAPVIKLTAGATEAEHLALLGLLNSSASCFWLRQVCVPKGGDYVGGEGARVRKTLWEERFAFNATRLGSMPIPEWGPRLGRLASMLDELAGELLASRPSTVIRSPDCTREDLIAARERCAVIRERMIA